MGKFYKALVESFDESVSTATMGAVFSVAAVMGVISVSGILMKPYEARDVVTSIHQRILLEKEMRELSRVNYSPKANVVTYNNFASADIFSDVSYFSPKPQLVKSNEKTDRAQSFDEQVRSENYWASLGESLKEDRTIPSSVPVVIPPVIVGIAD
ncbi:hypothetical protein [Leucothrix mucor]|uniref:hypothetical protein n=1 Tax=Leucothrix mucor TaxID=45248 RepID=UPI0003B79ACB|nr:hypothetical protein [Leucothrix mucor]